MQKLESANNKKYGPCPSYYEKFISLKETNPRITKYKHLG